MYESFYNLSAGPFNITPDPAFLYLSKGHKKALSAMIDGIERRKGFIAITGEVGTGKTTIIRSFLHDVDESAKVIYLFDPDITYGELLRRILREFDVDEIPESESLMIDQIHRVLISSHREDLKVVLIIDEAQNIPLETLEPMRMLSNFETSTEKLLQIVLVGQPEFSTILEGYRLRQLRERIAVRAKITSLTRAESRAYLKFRLNKVDADTSVFSPGALRKIVRHAKGNPRLLNIISDNALMTGFGYRENPVSAKTVMEVLGDLELIKGSLSSRRYLVPAAAMAVVALAFFSINSIVPVNEWFGVPIAETSVPSLENVASDTVEAESVSPPDEAVSATNSDEIVSLLSEAAQQQFAEGRLVGPEGDNALGTYQEVLRRDSGNAEAVAGIEAIKDSLITSAREAQVAQKWDQARELLGAVLTIDEGHESAHVALAELDQEEDAFEAALEETDQLASRAQDLVAKARETGLGFESGITAYREILSRDPTNADALAQMQDMREALIGWAFQAIRSKDWVSANDYFNQILQIDPEDTTALTMLETGQISELLVLADGQVREKLLTIPEDENAFLTYREVLRRDPGNEEAVAGIERMKKTYVGWASASIQRRDWASAVSYLQRALQIDRSDAEVLGVLATIPSSQVLALADRQVAQGRLARPTHNNALLSYKTVLDRDPNNPRALAGINAVKERLVTSMREARAAGQWAEAREMGVAVLEIDADNESVRSALSELEQQEAANEAALDIPRSN